MELKNTIKLYKLKNRYDIRAINIMAIQFLYRFRILISVITIFTTVAVVVVVAAAAATTATSTTEKEVRAKK